MALTHLFAIIVYSISNGLEGNLLFFIELLCNNNFGKKLQKLNGQISRERSVIFVPLFINSSKKLHLTCVTEF